MKKIFILVGIVLILSGCGKYDDKSLIKDFSKKINNADAYHMTADLEIYRNEEKYTYSVDSSYKKSDLFKVNLINKNNNHEQIILKNSEGVYVLTPSLNKSFKFQSDWPYNNSQIYLLQPIITDMNNDKDRTFEDSKDGGYIITSSVNYSTEKDFKSQKTYFDKNKNLVMVEVLDSESNVKMRLTVIELNFNVSYDENYFEASTYQINEDNSSDKNIDNKREIKQNTNEEEMKSTENSSAKIDEIIYPMYVPAETQLSSQDVVSTSTGERIILTFTGESPFTVVQENVSKTSSENYVYGDPYIVLDTVGAITDYSVSWISNNVEYSVMSDSMNVDELLTVAQSINVKAVGK